MEDKAIIFDASTLIGFAMNGLLVELSNLKQIFKGKFIIPHEVQNEIVDKPLNIKRFELQALKLRELIHLKILETPDVLGLSKEEISTKTKELMDKANNMFFTRKREVHLIDVGETAALAVSKILTEKKIKNVLAVDERTARILCEDPRKLKELMERKIHARVELKKDNFDTFKGFKFIRSTELIYIAYKKKLVRLTGDGRVLDAYLWALKSTGCAISPEEIEEIKSLEKR
jgi:hypothetical protein